MTQQLQIDLTEQSKRTIKILFDCLARYIYKLINIRFVEYKSKLYFQMSTNWHDGLPENITSEETKLLAHEDSSCGGYWDYECKFACEPMCKKKSLEFKYIYNYDECGANEYFDQEEDLHVSVIAPLKKIHEFIFDSKSTPEIQISRIVFLMKKPLTITNTSGFNFDHRGSDHIPIDLPFEPSIKLEDKFSFKELVDSMYRIKSHKFDYWYELFCGVNKVTSNTQSIKIYVNFDHGS